MYHTLTSDAIDRHLTALFDELPSSTRTADADWPTAAGGVYVLYKDEEVRYVGQTGHLNTRLRSHRRTKTFDLVRLYEEPRTESDRLELETLAILHFRPAENKAILINRNRAGVWRPAQFKRVWKPRK